LRNYFALLPCGNVQKRQNRCRSNTEIGLVEKRVQKIFNYDRETAIAMIRQFKSLTVSAKSSGAVNLTSSDSLTVDSAVYLVEGTLNYDFDFVDDSTFSRDSKVFEFVQSIPFDASSQKIQATALQALYNEFADSNIATKVNSNDRVRVVDIEVILTSTNVSFKAITFLQFGTFNTVCPPISQNTNPKTNSSAQIHQSQLQACMFSNPCNTMAYYYTNVQQQLFFNYLNSYPTELWYNYYSPSTGPYYYNGNDMSVITPAALTNFIANSASLITTNKPSTFHYMTAVQTNFFYSNNTSSPGFGAINRSWWEMLVTYAVPLYIITPC